jgi:hypothetical protein
VNTYYIKGTAGEGIEVRRGGNSGNGLRLALAAAAAGSSSSWRSSEGGGIKVEVLSQTDEDAAK